jgi:hypothetical protein
LNAGAEGYASDIPMHKRNAVQLRLALSAAAVCAVLAAASLSGAHRAGPPSITTVPETAPILAKSISTIGKPSVEKARGSLESFATRVIEPRLRSDLDMHKGE